MSKFSCTAVLKRTYQINANDNNLLFAICGWTKSNCNNIGVRPIKEWDYRVDKVTLQTNMLFKVCSVNMLTLYSHSLIGLKN